MSKLEDQCLAVVRLRGTINVRRDVKDTLRMLHLTRANHATIISPTPQYLGMLQKAKDLITWGEISKENILGLLRKRGEITGGRRLTDDHVKEKGCENLEEVAEKIYTSRLRLKDLDGVKPVFRLHPPSKGYKKSLKRDFTEDGELGYRGEKINELIRKMI